MSPFLIDAALYGVLIPGVVAALFGLAARPWRRDADGKLAGGLACVALLAAYVAGHRGLVGGLELSPIDISGWLPHMVAVAALVGVAQVLVGERALVRAVIGLVGATLIVWLVTRPQLEFRFTGMTGVWVVLGGALALTGYQLAVARAMRNESTRVGAALALIIAGVAPAMVALSGSLLLGQLGGGLAAGVGALAVIAFVFQGRAIARALPTVVALGTGALVALAYLYASMRYQVIVALALAPVAVVVVQEIMARVVGEDRESALARFGWVARLAVLVAFAGLAGMFAAAEETVAADDDDYGYGYGYE